MRLWHKALIKVLPRQQLVAQWRELSVIATQIQENKLNHILVNYVTQYDISHFISYAFYVKEEMKKRGYQISDKVWNKIKSLSSNPVKIMSIYNIFPNHHTNRYLIQCFYNLQEKYDRNGIVAKDYALIEDKVNKTMNICSFGETVTIKPDGIHPLSPHEYEEIETIDNAFVSILKCKKCGDISIGWQRKD